MTVTNTQYKRWKTYIQKGLMPPPYLDKLILDSMKDGGHGKEPEIETVYLCYLSAEVIRLATGKSIDFICSNCGHIEQTMDALDYLEWLEIIKRAAAAWVPTACSKCKNTIMPTEDEVLFNLEAEQWYS